jgi:hypothetical protein
VRSREGPASGAGRYRFLDELSPAALNLDRCRKDSFSGGGFFKRRIGASGDAESYSFILINARFTRCD